MAVSAIIFKRLSDIIWKAAETRVSTSDWMVQHKLKNRLESSALRAIDELEPLFSAEGLTQQKQDFVFDTCLSELLPLIDTPEEFFAGSLTGEKLYKRQYSESGPPQPIVDEGLEQPFRLVYPRVADRFCAYLPLVGKMQVESLKEILKRFDATDDKLSRLAIDFKEYTERPGKDADTLFHQLNQSITAEVLANLALTGLHGEREYQVGVDDIFVLPSIAQQEGKLHLCVVDEEQSLTAFTAPGGRTVVEGQPGAGKTTWACWLQRLALRKNQPILAVRVRLREYADVTPPAYHDIVRKCAGVHLAKRLKESQIDGWIDAGKIVFILDGFDEVPPPRRAEFRKWLDAFHVVAPTAAIVVTSRPLSTNQIRSLPKRWLQWQIEPFDEPRVRRYVELWYKCCPFLADDERGASPDALLAQLKRDRSLKDLTGNPLMLSTLLTVHHRDGQQLPRGRAQLYRRYIDGMLGMWEQRIHVKREVDLTADQKRKLLTHIALHFHTHDIDQLGEEESDGKRGLHQVVATYLPELDVQHPAPAVLEELRERTGMLDGPGTYAFIHKSVGEFLFGEALKEGHLTDQRGEKLDRQWLFSRRQADRWRGVLYFWAGQASVSDLIGFIEEIEKQKDAQDAWLSLALVADQADRLPKAWMRKWILAFVSKPLEVHSSLQHILHLSLTPSDEHYQIEVDGRKLPGLSHVTCREAIRTIASASNTPSIKLLSAVSVSFEATIWLDVILSPTSLEEWSTMITLPYSKKMRGIHLPSRERYAICIFATLCGNLLRNGLKDGWKILTIEATIALFPSLQTKAVFILIASANRVYASGTKEKIHSAVKTLSVALQKLATWPIDPAWLASSFRFHHYWNNDTGPIDILLTLKKHIAAIDSSKLKEASTEDISIVVRQLDSLIAVRGNA
jgi:hypothetical protein